MDITVAQMWALAKWAYRLKGREVENIDAKLGLAELPPEWTAEQAWHSRDDTRPVFRVRDFDDATGLDTAVVQEALNGLCDRLVELVCDDEDIRWYAGPAGRRSLDTTLEGPGILVANWNRPVPTLISDLWESRGGEIEWCDCGSECTGCNGWVQTEPDSYGWQPQYVNTDCGLICVGCLADDEEAQREYIARLVNNPRSAMQRQFALEPHGFVEVRERADTGLHTGQDDDPKAVMRNIRAAGCGGDVVFQIDSTGQFDAQWSVWYRPEDFDPAVDDIDDLETDSRLRDEVERARDAVSGDIRGRSPAAAMKAALRDAAKQEEAAGPAPAGFVRCVTAQADGTAVVRDIPHDEFVRGGFKRQ